MQKTHKNFKIKILLKNENFLFFTDKKCWSAALKVEIKSLLEPAYSVSSPSTRAFYIQCILYTYHLFSVS